MYMSHSHMYYVFSIGLDVLVVNAEWEEGGYDMMRFVRIAEDLASRSSPLLIYASFVLCDLVIMIIIMIISIAASHLYNKHMYHMQQCSVVQFSVLFVWLKSHLLSSSDFKLLIYT